MIHLLPERIQFSRPVQALIWWQVRRELERSEGAAARFEYDAWDACTPEQRRAIWGEQA